MVAGLDLDARVLTSRVTGNRVVAGPNSRCLGFVGLVWWAFLFERESRAPTKGVGESPVGRAIKFLSHCSWPHAGKTNDSTGTH